MHIQLKERNRKEEKKGKGARPDWADQPAERPS
jgi:hypothetical protein